MRPAQFVFLLALLSLRAMAAADVRIAILAGQKLNTTGLTDRAQSIMVGLLLGADALLDVERLGQDQDKTRQYLRLVFRQPVRRLRFTVTGIHESESMDQEDPPWLNLVELTLFESREEPQ